MAKSRKIKRPQGTIKPCTNCFNPQYLKFNFTYFSIPKNFLPEYKVQMLSRFIELSSDPYLVIAKRPKNTGFEFEPVDIHKEIPSAFKKRFEEKYYSKFAIMRLYTNNNPIVARIVGIMINKIFYVMFLFIGDNEGYKR
ncbi:MAG: hypothetical protein LUF92_03200 [Clostridiales bacterium]|nr:hypothetical protein [Clostridiales bacterium]